MTIRMEVGLADSVKIAIVDKMGRAILTATEEAPHQVDSREGPRWVFDYLWNTSNAGSGIYFIAVTASKAGQAPIQKLIKVAVIR